jgi:hypothetical protein
MRLEEAIKFAAVPDTTVRAPAEQRGWLEEDVRKSKGRKLTEAERKQLRGEAMFHLWAMARGELTGYDVRPATAAVLHALHHDELALPALEILGRLPGLEAQQRLAGVVLDPARGKLRVAAAFELNRHLQKHGVGLSMDQLNRLRELHANTMEDVTLRAQIALVIGNLRTTPRQTGERLLQPPK